MGGTAAGSGANDWAMKSFFTTSLSILTAEFDPVIGSLALTAVLGEQALELPLLLGVPPEPPFLVSMHRSYARAPAGLGLGLHDALGLVGELSTVGELHHRELVRERWGTGGFVLGFFAFGGLGTWS